MSKHYRKENDCLNCGKVVEGKFCSNCGQENIEIKEPFWTFVSHGVGHYFHYDSKFKKTLRPFLTKPGQLTKDHMEGRRASHIPPISLYLFITLVYFLCAPVFNKKRAAVPVDAVYDSQTNKMIPISESEARIFEGKDTIYSIFENDDLAVQREKIVKLDSLIKTETSDKQRRIAEKTLERYQKLNIVASDTSVTSYRIRQSKLTESDRDAGLNKFWKERKINYREKTGHNFDKAAFKDKYFPKLLFILMPLFAFFLMLNFRRNKKLYMEHLIYTIHLFSFAFFSFFVSEFLQYLTPPSIDEYIGAIAFLILVWYTYRSIRTVYQRSRWATIRKLFSISVLFLVSLTMTYILGMALILGIA